MSPDLVLLIDRWRDRTLDAAGRLELDRQCRDPGQRAAILAEIRFQGHLAAALDERDAEQVWATVRQTLERSTSTSGTQRALDAVEHRFAILRRRRVVAWLAAAGLLLAVGAWLWWPAGPADCRIAAGAALVRRGGADLALAPGARLDAGDGLVASLHGATLRYADGSELALEAGTRLWLQVSSAGKRAMLEGGTLTAEVAHQPAGAPLVLMTPSARAEVVGTRLRLAAQPGSTRLEVVNGQVRLSRIADGASVLVGAGLTATAVAADTRPLLAVPTVGLVNGRPEQGEGRSVPGWRYYNNGTDADDYGILGAAGDAGRCLSIRTGDRQAATHTWWYQELPVQEGQRYRMTCEARAWGGADYMVYVGVEFHTQDGRWIDAYQELARVAYQNPRFPAATVPGSQVWQAFSGEFTVPRGAATLRLRLGLAADARIAAEAGFRLMTLTVLP